jgi:hypothetical protein
VPPSAMSDFVESVKTWRALVVMEMEVVGGGRKRFGIK